LNEELSEHEREGLQELQGSKVAWSDFEELMNIEIKIFGLTMPYQA